MAFLVTNALMWNTPVEALAETCEADNSIFNMPLLLFVALVGATVGGMVTFPLFFFLENIYIYLFTYSLNSEGFTCKHRICLERSIHFGNGFVMFKVP